jgi:hypothetical protein
MFVIILPVVQCGPLEDAGCRTSPHYSEKVIGYTDPGQTHATTTLNNGSTAVAYVSRNSKVVPNTACSFANRRLNVKVCSPSVDVLCSDVDICLTTVNNGDMMYVTQVFDIIIGDNIVYILAGGTDTLSVYGCTPSFGKCTKTVPSVRYGASSFSSAYYNSKLYITYADDDQSTMVAVCGTACSITNMTALAKFPGKLNYPVPLVNKDKLYVTLYDNNDPSSSIVIYMCDLNVYSCTFARRIVGLTIYGTDLEFNVATYESSYYIAYKNYYGSYTDISMTKCDLAQDGSFGDCSKTFNFDYDQQYTMYGKPSIAFAPYLGAVIAISNVISTDNTYVIIRINMDFSDDDKFSTVYRGQLHADINVTPRLLNKHKAGRRNYKIYGSELWCRYF